jgi:type VI secretion system secreted protein VgrG
VGKSGEEIWVDEYGRVQVQFHWDREGKKDENSSCWIRVAQNWAGKRFGIHFHPRVGDEVIVNFLEGDPDQPIISGSVYNANQMPPYDLPGEDTKSTIKSSSSKGGGGSNEIRFEDKADEEELYIHAQKDYNIVVENDLTKQVANDETNTIMQNRETTIEEGDDDLIVEQGNRKISVNTGNEEHEVKGNRDITVSGDESHTNDADYTQEISGDHSETVSGNYTLKVSGDITIEADGNITIKGSLIKLN